MPESTDLELRRMGDSAAMTDDELARAIRIAQDLAKSQMFKGADPRTPITPHEAFAKMLIGRDLGISPTQALMSVDIVRGNIQMRAVLLASFVRKSEDYDYAVGEHTDEACEIQFTYRGREAGLSRFTMAEADKAGLTKPTRNGEPSMYAKHPKNMLWARAMSNGVRWYCPDLTGGVPVYTEADVFEDKSAQITAGEGDGQPLGLDLGPEVEKVIARATELGHAGLSDRASIEVALGEQPDEYKAEWCRKAHETLDRMPERDEMGRAFAREEAAASVALDRDPHAETIALDPIPGQESLDVELDAQAAEEAER